MLRRTNFVVRLHAWGLAVACHVALLRSNPPNMRRCHWADSMRNNLQTERPARFEEISLRIRRGFLGYWLSRDPIGEAGGLNLYAYVRNDPLNEVDPLGLLTTITTSSGTVITVSHANTLINAINSQPAGTITNITLAGHANQTSQGIGDDPEGMESVDVNSAGVPVVSSPFLKDGPVPLAPLVNGKLAPGATIKFTGCHAGSEDKSPDNPSGTNIAQATSAVVPNMPVSGSSTYTFGDDVSTSNSHIPFTQNTYINGKKQ